MAEEEPFAGWSFSGRTATAETETLSPDYEPYAEPPMGRFAKPKSSARGSQRRASLVIQRVHTGKRVWKFTLRDWDDDEYQDWWFCSTAVPLLAATIGPLANVLSIAALVTSWRKCVVAGVDSADTAVACVWNGDPNTLVQELGGQPFGDPLWCYRLNVVSLAVGLIGNFFLLCNFTKRIRYIVALPVTIVAWYIATSILIGITVGMERYVPPVRPEQTYTQGFWYAVYAAVLYMICSMLLMLNMLGYFLGHYPQHFTLTESQRTLILQTMLFFIWLAGGGAVFSRIETLYGTGETDWSYANSLYFCDVTILTVGLGDLVPTSNVGRGIVFPFSVGGIIMLGLMVSSIAKFASELGSEKIIHRHAERSRMRTVGRTVTNSMELKERRALSAGEGRDISAPFNPVHRTMAIKIEDGKASPINRTASGLQSLRRAANLVPRPRKAKLILLREEKDRFDAMRRIQQGTTKFKRWYALFMSVAAFGILWCVGAVVFWECEKKAQGMTYFQALYFCYISLLTIGYGDLAPRSNPGRPFFVVWSLFAVPTMTILVSDLGDTVINKFKQGTFTLADFTVLPKAGVWRKSLATQSWLTACIQKRKERRAAQKRLEEGFRTGPEEGQPPTIQELAKEAPTRHELAHKLAKAIHRTAHDVKDNSKKRYTYEEWVEYTQLIRFTAKDEAELQVDEAEEASLVRWDWLGQDSPMMARGTEAEFVLHRLCESMSRYVSSVALSAETIEPVVKEGPADPEQAVHAGSTVSPNGTAQVEGESASWQQRPVPREN